jgi:exonuclease SbcC
MKIELLKLILINFKGIRDLAIIFKHVTGIWGADEAGKTTVLDAFLWLLFGKDSTGRADFQAKTLDSRGKEIPKIEHEVSAEMEVNGERVALRRVLREKWTKKRGSAESEFTGNETLYYWNDVPLKESEYQKKIDDMIKEGLFKLITSPFYFNSLKWQQRREALMRMAGEITNDEIAAGDTAFHDLIKSLGKKTIEEYKKEIAAKKKLLKDSIETIPTRIDEANRSLPDPVDYAAIEKQLKELEEQLRVIDAGLQNEAEAAKEANRIIADKIRDRGNLQSQVQQVEIKIRKDMNSARADRETVIAAKKRELRNLQDESQNNSLQITQTNKNIAVLEKEREELRIKWETLNIELFEHKEVFNFDENQCFCPTCKQRLPADTIESSRNMLEKNFNDNKAKLEADFNTNKANRINTITDRGTAISKEIEQLQANLAAKNGDANQQKIADLQAEIATLESTHTSLNESEASQITTAIAASNEITDLNKKSANLQAEIDALQKPDNKTTEELKERKANLTGHIAQFNKELANKAQIERIKLRIADLEKEEKNLAQQIADLEGTEFTIQQFTRAKIDALEARINGKFKHVKFKPARLLTRGCRFPN